MPVIREINYDVTDRERPKIKHCCWWWWWSAWRVRRWINNASPISSMPPGIEGYVQFKPVARFRWWIWLYAVVVAGSALWWLL